MNMDDFKSEKELHEEKMKKAKILLKFLDWKNPMKKKATFLKEAHRKHEEKMKKTMNRRPNFI